ncbi:hypothetical protein MTO96_017498 [Rhipicephalus appendiculatus]
MARPMLILLVVSAGLVESFHRETGKHCQRLGKQPSEQTPAETLLVSLLRRRQKYSSPKDLNLTVLRASAGATGPLAFAGAPIATRTASAGVLPGAHLPAIPAEQVQNRLARLLRRLEPPTSGPHTSRTTGPPSGSAVDRNSTTNEEVPKKQPQK